MSSFGEKRIRGIFIVSHGIVFFFLFVIFCIPCLFGKSESIGPGIVTGEGEVDLGPGVKQIQKDSTSYDRLGEIYNQRFNEAFQAKRDYDKATQRYYRKELSAPEYNQLQEKYFKARTEVGRLQQTMAEENIRFEHERRNFDERADREMNEARGDYDKAVSKRDGLNQQIQELQDQRAQTQDRSEQKRIDNKIGDLKRHQGYADQDINKASKRMEKVGHWKDRAKEATPRFRPPHLAQGPGSDPLGLKGNGGRGWFGTPPGAKPPGKPAGNPKDVVIKGNATDPKTGIRTEGVRLRDGTTTVTQFDKNGNVIGQTTRGPGGGLSFGDTAKGIFASQTGQWGGGSGPKGGGGPPVGGGGGPVGGGQGPGQGSGQGPGQGPTGGGGPAGGGVPVGGGSQGGGEDPGGGGDPGAGGHAGPPSSETVNQWIKDTFGEEMMKVVEVEPMAPASGNGWTSLPEVNFSDPNNPYSLGGVNEPVSQNVDIVGVAKQDPAVSHVAFDSGRGEIVVVMKNGTTLSSDAYLKSKDAAGAGKSEPAGKAQEDKAQQDAAPRQEDGLPSPRTEVFYTPFGSFEYIPGPPEPPGDHWDFLPGFVPGESVYEGIDLKRQSKRIGKALDGFLKEGIKNPFQSSGQLEFDGLLGKWSRQSPGSQASLGDLFQGNNLGGGSSSGGASSSSCN